MFVVFATGVVPVDWKISTWGESHLAVINIIVTIIATVTTAHVKFLIHTVVCEFANVFLVNGFTLSQFEWMQGVKEWSIFTRFPARKRPFWALLYLAMALHSASVVSIMQPKTFIKNVHFRDTAPCGVHPRDLTLDPMDSLPRSDQILLDESAYSVGLQLGTYYQAVAWNTTTTAFGRPYVKENISYGAVGGLHDGLQNVSGVFFDVQCATDADGQSALNSVWARIFPSRSFPLVHIGSQIINISVSGFFADPPVNTSSLQSITSSRIFNLTTSEMALYSLVNANGSGGILGISAENTVACTWLAVPKLVDVILVNWVAHSYTVKDAITFPEYVGRGVLYTVKGMAQAALLGARLDRDRTSATFWQNVGAHPVPSTAEMLAVMLSDGARTTFAGFAAIAGETVPAVSMCFANVRTIHVHWRFGNAHQLGWIAIVVTLGTGISGIFVVWSLSRAKRAIGVEALNLARIFMLAVDSDIPKLPDEELREVVLRLQGHRIVANP
jgi:hypothetical protein